MLDFSKKFSICCLLDSHEYKDENSAYDFLFAANSINSFSADKNILPQFSSFLAQQKDWLFGHISYDLKNEIEGLSVNHPDKISFPIIFFFQPDIVIEYKNERLSVSSVLQKPEEIFEEIISIEVENGKKGLPQNAMQARICKEEYIRIIKKLQQHILRGDCYEINFCQEFFAENISIVPENIYKKLSQISPAPFAAFYKLNGKYLMCASPERFLKKTGTAIISQPIKGTIKRNIENETEDEILKQILSNSAKDKSENVMIADLMRNDLSKICKEATVRAEELFGIYSFAQVHQMISTVKGTLKNEIDFADVLKATFPMGSMTGAPKRSVLQLIDKYEITARGIFSGSVGYITPKKDFDFNVVIRSIMYNASEKYVSYKAGSGITFYSNAEDEYEECLLKGNALQKTLQ